MSMNVNLREDTLTLSLDRSGHSPILKIICPNSHLGEFQERSVYPQLDNETPTTIAYVRPNGHRRTVGVYFWLRGGVPKYRLIFIEDSIPVSLL